MADWAGEEFAPLTQTAEPADHGHMIGQGLINGCSNIASALIGILLIPVMLRGLGIRLFGFWVLLWTVANVVSAVADLGVHLTVIREVGGAGGDSDEVARLVSAAANLYLRLAIAGALSILVVGAIVVFPLRLAPETHHLLAMSLVVVSIGFIADQMSAFQFSVLEGLQRFDLSNLLAVSSSLITALGIVCVLAFGGSLLGVVEIQASVSILALIAAYVMLTHLAPRLRQRPARLDWKALRPHFGFSVLTQLLILANTGLWEGPLLLIGLILGPVALVPFHLGRKFPHSIGTFAWELVAVMTPMASRNERTGDVMRSAEAIGAGTRWVTVSTLPIYIVMAIIGPDLLRTWLGHVPPGTVLVFELMIVAAVATTIEGAASSVLLGLGKVGVLLTAAGGSTVAALALTGFLLGPLGPVGAAAALAVSVPITALIVIRSAGKVCNLSISALARELVADTWMPAAACAGTTLLLSYCISLGSWPRIIAASFASAVAYFAAYWCFRAREEERILVRRGCASLVDHLLAAAAAVYPVLRTIPRKLGIRAASHPRVAAITLAVLDPESEVELWDKDYMLGPDHWGYTTNPYERARHLIAAKLLDSSRGGAKFARAIEIGCAEGVFTELLADRCQALLAVDFSKIALERARKRCAAKQGVTFQAWDLRHDAIPGKFDLIVAMDVLMYIRRPAILRKIKERLVAGLNHGGLLLVCDFRWGKALESSWVGKLLLFGGKWVIGELAAHPALEVVESFSTENHFFALLRKL